MADQLEVSTWDYVGPDGKVITMEGTYEEMRAAVEKAYEDKK